MRIFFKLLTLCTAIGAGTVAVAADYSLTITSSAPPTLGVNTTLWPTLIQMMEDATDGRLTAQIKYRLGPPPAQMDLVQDGAADRSWIFHGYQTGRFTATKLIELPGYEGNAEAASVAYWRVHEAHLAAADGAQGGDDRDARRLAQVPAERETVFARHHSVEDDRGRAFGHGHAQLVALHVARQRLADFVVIVDYKHVRGGVHGRELTRLPERCTKRL